MEPVNNHAPENSSAQIERHGDDSVHYIRIRTQECDADVDVAVKPGMISLYFNSISAMSFSFHGGRYVHTMQPRSLMIIYEPQHASTFMVKVPAMEELITIRITVEALHRLLHSDLHELRFLRSENIDKRFHSERAQSSGVEQTMYQIATRHCPSGLERVFALSKTYELLFHAFRVDADVAINHCPFLADEVNMERIRNAKQILHDELRDPPGIKELARRIRMNETHLKSGFKRIYGCTIHTWVVEQRMGSAYHLLESGSHNVNEVAEAVGYQNVSQFITTFKRRYGITPGKLSQTLREVLGV